MQIDAFLSKTLHKFNWKYKLKDSMEENKPKPLVSVTESTTNKFLVFKEAGVNACCQYWNVCYHLDEQG